MQRTWKFGLKKPANPHETWKKWDDIYFVVPSWSGRGESNPRIQLGKLMFYHWTTPAKHNSIYCFYNALLYYHISFWIARGNGEKVEMILSVVPKDKAVSWHKTEIELKEKCTFRIFHIFHRVFHKAALVFSWCFLIFPVFSLFSTVKAQWNLGKTWINIMS